MAYGGSYFSRYTDRLFDRTLRDDFTSMGTAFCIPTSMTKSTSALPWLTQYQRSNPREVRTWAT